MFNFSAIPTFYQNLRKEGAYFGMASSSSSTTSKEPTKTSDSSRFVFQFLCIMWWRMMRKIFTVISNAVFSEAKAKSDLELAIELSLKESQQKSGSKSLYPTVSGVSTNSNLAYNSYQGAPSTNHTADKQVG